MFKTPASECFSLAAPRSSNQITPSMEDCNCGSGKKSRRTAIQKVEDKTQRQVTFSKRRQTLFSKAEDLHSLFANSGEPSCSPRVAIFGFTVGGNPTARGFPSLDPILDDYLSQFAADHHPKRRRVDRTDEKARVFDEEVSSGLTDVEFEYLQTKVAEWNCLREEKEKERLNLEYLQAKVAEWTSLRKQIQEKLAHHHRVDDADVAATVAKKASLFPCCGADVARSRPEEEALAVVLHAPSFSFPCDESGVAAAPSDQASAVAEGMCSSSSDVQDWGFLDDFVVLNNEDWGLSDTSIHVSDYEVTESVGSVEQNLQEMQPHDDISIDGFEIDFSGDFDQTIWNQYGSYNLLTC